MKRLKKFIFIGQHRKLTAEELFGKILKFKTKQENEAQYKFLCKECTYRKTCSLPYKNWDMEACDWREISETQLLAVIPS